MKFTSGSQSVFGGRAAVVASPARRRGSSQAAQRMELQLMSAGGARRSVGVWPRLSALDSEVPGAPGGSRHAPVWLPGNLRSCSFLSHPRAQAPACEGVSLSLKGLVLSLLPQPPRLPGLAGLSAHAVLLGAAAEPRACAGSYHVCRPAGFSMRRAGVWAVPRAS